MNILLKYGKTTAEIPFSGICDLLEIREPEYSVDETVFQDELGGMIGDTYHTVAVVISDKTRLCEYSRYLPLLTGVLKKKGYTDRNITFYIAYGTHPRQSDEECRKIYGEVYDQFTFIHHDCSEEEQMIRLGITSLETPVRVRKDIVESDVIITFGAISHHYFAGYGGGRKLLFPGLGEKNAIYKNHSMYLDFTNHTPVTACRPGNLLNNPVADDLKEIDSFLPEKISIHAILNSKGKVCKLITGKTYENFLGVCREYDTYFKMEKDEHYDLVLASCGGYPKDINFIQSHKSVHQAASFVRDGGTLILLAECVDGMGNDIILQLFQTGSKESLFAMLMNKYEGNGGTAIAMMTKTERIKIFLVTELSEEICTLIGVHKIIVEDVKDLIKNYRKIAVIRNASLIFR